MGLLQTNGEVQKSYPADLNAAPCVAQQCGDKSLPAAGLSFGDPEARSLPGAWPCNPAYPKARLGLRGQLPAAPVPTQHLAAP